MNDSNLLVRFVIVSLVLSTSMVVLLSIAVVVVRIANGLGRRRRKTLTARWRSVFVVAYTGGRLPTPLPAISKRDWFTVLQLFEGFQALREHDRPRAAEILPRLDSIARKLMLDRYALGLLKKNAPGAKIVAFNVLGSLRDPRAYEPANRFCTDESPELSRAAAHCALRIDPTFIDRMLALIRERDDWARPRVELMLREIEPQRLDRAMRAALEFNDEAARRRLLDYTRMCTPAAAGEICREIVNGTGESETIAAALRSLAPLADENDREIALAFCRHPESAVALSALRVLRKCVRPEDAPLLHEMTAHRDYWVRLRAAEVVVQLFGDAERVEAFAAQHPDRYARDAVHQALAENKRHAARRKLVDRRAPAALEMALA